jgi:uncharacterized membrane protein
MRKLFETAENKALFLILALALLMRLVVIGQSYWLDEAIGAVVIRNHTLTEILLQFPKGDNHPPFYYVMIKLWSGFFGDGEVALRSLSVVFGVLTVYALYLITKQTKILKGKLVFLPALLLATSPFHIYYSQEARMYPVTAFFATVAVYNFLKTLENRNARNFIWFSLFVLLIAATDYVPIFLLPVFWLYAAIGKKEKSWMIKFLAAHIPLIVFSLLWLPFFLHQSAKGSWLLETLPAWRDLAGGANFKQAALMWNKFVLGRITFIDKGIYYPMLVAATIPFAAAFLLFLKSLKKVKKHAFIALWFILPTLLVFLASFKVPAFNYFRMIFVLPPFYLIAAAGAAQFKARGYVLATLLLFINLTGWFIYITDEAQQREQWRQAISFVEGRAEADDIVLFTNPEPFAPWQYYSKNKVTAFGATDSISATEAAYYKTVELINGQKGVYYFDYLNDLIDRKDFVRAGLIYSGFVERETFAFTGVGHVRYWVRDKEL